MFYQAEFLYFLMLVKCIAFLCQAIIVGLLVVLGTYSKLPRSLWVLIILVFIAALIVNASWIVNIVREITPLFISYPLVLVILRIGWFFDVIQYEALFLFIDYLIQKEQAFKLTNVGKLVIAVGSVLCSFILYLSIFQCTTYRGVERSFLELFMYKIIYFYTVMIVFLSIYRCYMAMQNNLLPKILSAQLKIFMYYYIVPYLLLEFSNCSVFEVFGMRVYYSLSALSDLFLTCGLYFCAKKIMRLRFLNIRNHVESASKFNFIDDFKNVLEELAKITTLDELAAGAQEFFKIAFGVPVTATRLYIRGNEKYIAQGIQTVVDFELHARVENFIYTIRGGSYHDMDEMLRCKILIKDEIEFTNFYEKSSFNTAVLEFLDAINADIFLPIYSKKVLTGYVVVERNARKNELFTRTERDEMLVFASYVSISIDVLRYENVDALIHQTKELKEELYHKHQEINQYKESLRSFLRTSGERSIGILFYKGRHITYGNREAEQLLGKVSGERDDDVIMRNLSTFARDIQGYRSTRMMMFKGNNGRSLIAYGLPGPDTQSVTVMVYYSDISDTVKGHLDQVKDASQWDYRLYLETTSSGKLINQLIPGSSEELLNVKINLLKIALSKKAALVNVSSEDLQATVDIIHHISLRQKLQVITLHAPEKNHEVMITLFGMNPLYGVQADPLLSKLHAIGTLLIENVHFLSRETQERLAEFITYGFFHVYKSDQKISSDVRIICSTNRDLALLVQDNTFSGRLYNELQKTSFTMLSLLTFSSEELVELAESFAEKAVQTTAVKVLIELNDKDKDRLIKQKPVSLQELKEHVKQLLINKAKKQEVRDYLEFESTYDVSDPQLFQAVRLGKNALKDPHIMTFLWNKFKNQSKIATLLKVNKSSINRRCKQYNLVGEHEL
jgi:transcriptional regulator with PAS, ATPase and Fis domain